MKKGMILLAVIIAACGAPKTADKNLNELFEKRDSLQAVQLKTEKELNKIAMQIAQLDTSINPDDMSIVKQITMQKNRIAATQLKIKELENKMTQAPKDNLTPVSVKEIKGEEFNHYIIVYGKVEADNYALISPEMGGQIKDIHVKEGQQVVKGQLLVSLNTDAVEMQIQSLESSLKLANSTYEKQDTLWKQGIGSEIQYLGAKTQKETLEAQLEGLKAQLRMSQIRAPFDGVVNKIYMKKGELASPGFPMVEFVNLNKITIKSDISESYMGKVIEGQMVELSFSSFSDSKSIKTPIRRVSSVINNVSRTFEIELKIDNSSELIKPNMVSTISIEDYSSSNAFIIPSLAIMKDITGSYVYLAVEKDDKPIVRKQYIKTGKSYQENSEVLEGLKEGDQVIVKGYHLVSAGLPVKVVNQE